MPKSTDLGFFLIYARMILMKKFFQKHFWGTLLSLFFLLVFFLNFPFKNGLFGWDNLMNEFDLWLNFKRALFSSIWIDNQGLGHIGGHGHAGLFFHVISLFFIIFLFPFLGEFMIRPIFIFGLYVLGGFGVFKLTDYIFNNKKVSFWSAIFYSINLMTIQQFYLPLESFIIFHGILPWALWSLLNYWQKPNKKSFLIFFFIQLYFSQIGFLPPLFVVYFILLSCIFFSFFFYNFKLKKWLIFFKKTFLIGLVILLVNSYWLVGTIVYTFSNSSYDYLHSLNNKISTPAFNENSLSFGNFDNVALGESFFFHTYDQNINNGQLYKVFEPWLNWFNQPLIQFLAYSIFGLVFAGWLLLFLCKFKSGQKKAILFGFGLFFLFSLISLGQNIFIFKPIINFIKNIPVINQAFRATFTKFSVPFALAESLFLSLGLIVFSRILIKFKKLFSFFKTKIMRKKNIENAGVEVAKNEKKLNLKMKLILNPKKKEKKIKGLNSKFKSKVSFIFLLIIFVIYSWPLWRGKLFFQTLKVQMPYEYQQTFDFFKSQKKWGRIALLPFSSNWGWHFYDWNYTGSGFLWYGLDQPILDRSFDSWSNYNEGFYFELKEALYKEDEEQFDNVLEKYKINYLIIDKNLIAPGSNPDSLYLQQLNDLLKQSQFYHITSFGEIKIYQINDGAGQKLFVPEKVSIVSSQERFLKFDPIYENEGNYVYDDFGIDYPFLQLASSREIDNTKLRISDKQIIYQNQTNSNNKMKIVFPELQNGESYGFGIYAQKKDETHLTLHLKAILPELADSRENYQPQSLVSVTVPNVDFYNDFSLNIGEQIFNLDWLELSKETWQYLGTTNLIYGNKLKVRFFKENLNKKKNLTKESLNKDLKNCQNGNLPANLSKEINNSQLVLKGDKEAGCLSFRIGEFEKENLPAFLKLNLKYTDQNVSPRLCLAREGDDNRICYNGQSFNPKIDSKTKEKFLSQYLVLINEGTYWLDLGIFPKINDKTEFILKDLSYEFINNVTDVFVKENFWKGLKNYYDPELKITKGKLKATYTSNEINSWLDLKKYDFANSNNCQPEKIGNAYLEYSKDTMQFRSSDGGASCYNEFFPYVDLKKGQLLVIENNYQKGKGLEFNLKNLNSWQVDRLDLLRTNGQHYYSLSAFPQSQYRGYDLGFSNYSALNGEAQSNLKNVKFLEYPNEYLASVKLVPNFETSFKSNSLLKNTKSFGSFLYWGDFEMRGGEKEVVVLNQGNHKLWQAYLIEKSNFCQLNKKHKLKKTIFNGWANGFWLDNNVCGVGNDCQVVAIFWPGIWQMGIWLILLTATIGVVGWGWKKK
jgi:hypothetical protein